MQTPTILLYGHGGFGNRGCEAIVRSTTALLHKEAPQAAVWLASERPGEDSAAPAAGIARVLPHGIAPLSVDRFINSVQSRLGADRETIVARTQAPLLRAAKQVNAALSIGGDTYCYKRPEMLYVVNRRLRALGVPTALWGCSVEPESLQGEMLADLFGYRALFARESLTYEALSAAGLPAVRSADPAFTLLPAETPLPPGFVPGRTVGLNISPLALGHAGDGEAALAALAALIRHVLNTTDNAVALIPHVLWVHDDDRLPLARLKALFAEEPRVLLLGDYGAPQLKDLISRLRCLVAARTHASIAAYSSGVPTLVLGYSVKARGIAQDLYGTADGHVLPVQELASESELIGAFDRLLATEKEERALLLAKVPEMTARAAAAVRHVWQWMEETRL